MLVGINVLAAFVVRDPETLGLRPDGSDIDGTISPRAEDDTGWALREAVRTVAFWRLAGVMMPSVLTIPAVYVHLPQYAKDLQVQAPRAHFVMLVGLWSLIGNVLLAWYADRIGRSRSFGLALAGFAAARGTPALTAASICFSLY